MFFVDTVKHLDVEENTFILNPTGNLPDPIKKAVKQFISHLSILKLKQHMERETFSFSNVSLQEVESEIKHLSIKKANTFNNIPVRNLKENIDITCESLHKIITHAITDSYFPEKLKLAEIYPHYKNEERKIIDRLINYLQLQRC